jgi:hypothetical protein
MPVTLLYDDWAVILLSLPIEVDKFIFIPCLEGGLEPGPLCISVRCLTTDLLLVMMLCSYNVSNKHCI